MVMSSSYFDLENPRASGKRKTMKRGINLGVQPLAFYDLRNVWKPNQTLLLAYNIAKP